MVFTKNCVHKVRIFNNFLHFVEIKVFLEARGFRPKFLGKRSIVPIQHFKMLLLSLFNLTSQTLPSV
jgi:hypothetical protein